MSTSPLFRTLSVTIFMVWFSFVMLPRTASAELPLKNPALPPTKKPWMDRSAKAAATPNKPSPVVKPPPQTHNLPKKKPRARKKRDPNRREYSILPAINYNSDRGFGFGALGSIAQFREGIEPYHWRLFFRLFATVKVDAEGNAEFPFHRDMIVFDLRGLLRNTTRIMLSAGFFRFTTTGYYGLGNAAPRDPARPRKYYEYDRMYPNASFGMFNRIIQKQGHRLELYSSLSFTHNTITPNREGKLEEDLRRSMQGNDNISQTLRNMLRGIRPHSQLKAVLGLQYDSRDHEFSPSRGMLHELSIRAILPGLAPGLAFAGGHLNLRFFVPIWKPYLVLAIRVLGDMLWGDVPLYELYSMGGIIPLEGPGGMDTVRGIRSQRFYGKIKLVGNVELRSVIFDFTVFRQRIRLGLIAFADTGRVWTDYSFRNDATRRSFDGDDFGFTLAVGGGGRLQWGETFIMRVDVGWSPTDQDWGAYFWVNHIF